MQFSVLFLLCSTAITSIFLPAEISPYEEKAFLCLIILYDIKIYKKFKSKTFPAPLKKVFFYSFSSKFRVIRTQCLKITEKVAYDIANEAS